MSYNFSNYFNRPATGATSEGQQRSADPRENYQRNNGRDTRVNKPSPKQTAYYMDLCARKKQAPQNVANMDFTQMGKAIEDLRKLPDPASDAQIERIKTLWTECNELAGLVGKRMKPITDEQLATLTGGREGTASVIIDKLMQKRNSYNDIAPPTEQQLETISRWFFCPDIPFEKYDVPKRVYLDKLSYWSTEYSVPEDLELRPWRLLTQDEFMSRIKTKFTKKTANKFIDDYRAVYYDWYKTRATQAQIRHISELEERLADLYKPAVVETYLEDGEIKERISESARERQAEKAYTISSPDELLQLSYDNASQLIDQLKSEISRTELSRFGNIYGNSQQELQDKHASYNERNGVGTAHDEQSARIKEYTALNDLVFKLEAVIGHSNETLHELVKESVLDSIDDQSDQCRTQLKDFMYETIDFNRNMQSVIRDVGRLYTMTEDSIIASELAQEIADEVFTVNK